MVAYILSIYKVFPIDLDNNNNANNNANNNTIYIICNIHSFDNANLNGCISALLKLNQCCIKTVIHERVKTFYSIIMETGGWDKWYITEMCRCVCSSMFDVNRIIHDQFSLIQSHQSQLEKNKYSCELCKYNCNIECQWVRHQSGKKHLDKLMYETNHDDKKSHICAICKKIYLSRTSLWKHNKVCSELNSQKDRLPTNYNYKFIDVENDIIFDTPEKTLNHVINISDDVLLEIIINQNKTLIAQNTEFKEIIIEQNAKMLEFAKQPTTTNTSNHNHFNLNVFLNETCKHAMTLTEFVNSLQINSYNVEYTGVHGYVAGISKIFMDGLRQLEVNMRPIHCTDLKREILYIKEDNVWEKDNPEKSKFKKALNTVVRKNMQQLREWMNQNPRCEILDTNEYHLHLKIMKQCIGGDVNQEDANNRKILRNIAKEVVIDRSQIFGAMNL
jgi:hypothetical protein